MTAAERQRLRELVSEARKGQLKQRAYITECDSCGRDLIASVNPRKRFCNKTCKDNFHRARPAVAA